MKIEKIHNKTHKYTLVNDVEQGVDMWVVNGWVVNKEVYRTTYYKWKKGIGLETISITTKKTTHVNYYL